VATVLSAAASFGCSVLSSKLLVKKEVFGDWKYLQNFIMFISYFINFGLYASGGRLIAATTDKRKMAIYRGYLIYFCLAGLAVIMLSTVAVGLLLPRLLNTNLFHIALLLMPLFIIHPLSFYFEYTFQGERKLLSLALFRTLPAIVYMISLYVLGMFSKGTVFNNALLFYSSSFIVCIVLLLLNKPIFKWGTSEWKDIRIQHTTYGIHIYWGALWGIGATYMLPVLIGLFNINNADVANFSLALAFIMPLAILPSIMGTSNFRNYITLPKIPASSFKKVILSSLLLWIALLLSIDYIIKIFLGPQYKDIGFLIKIGSLGAILHGMGDFVIKFLLAKGESKYTKKVSIAFGLIQLISSVILIKMFSATGHSSTGAIIGKSIGSAVFFIALFLYYHKKYVIGKSEGIKVNIIDEEPIIINESVPE
jgi:O-antigen/teichoic acid export membrane protein